MTGRFKELGKALPYPFKKKKKKNISVGYSKGNLSLFSRKLFSIYIKAESSRRWCIYSLTLSDLKSHSTSQVSSLFAIRCASYT